MEEDDVTGAGRGKSW